MTYALIQHTVVTDQDADALAQRVTNMTSVGYKLAKANVVLLTPKEAGSGRPSALHSVWMEKTD